MTIQLLTRDRKPWRQMDWSDQNPLPQQIIEDDGTFVRIGENPRTHLQEYVMLRPRVLPPVTVGLLLACLAVALPASAQLPQMQIYGQDTGTLRAVTVNASGQLSITCANCSGSGASAVDDAAFTAATDSGAPVMGFVTTDSVNAGDVGVVAMTATRALHTTIRDSAGDSVMDDTNNAINVNVVAGSTSGTQYTEADTDASITGNAIMFESNTGTNALSVVSASAPLPVSDAGGALTVDGTVTVTDGAGALNVIVDSGSVTVVDGGSTISVDDGGGALTVDGTVTVTDGAGALNVICDSGCGAGTQYAEDAAHTTGDQTMFVSGIRRDTTPASSAGTAGDYAAFNLDANGRLYVQAVLYNSSGSELTVATDGTVGSAIGTTGPLGTAVYADFDGSAIPTITNVDTEGELVPIAASLKGVQYVMVVNEDGSLERGTSTTPMIVGDGSGALNVIVDSGTVTTVSTVTTLSQLGGTAVPIEDAAESAGGTGIYAMSVRRDTAASSAGTNGDNATLNTDASGRLWTNPGVIGVEDEAETGGGGLAMAGAVVRSTAAGSSATAGDNATINVDTIGRLWTRNGNPCADHARITTVAINTSTSGNVELVALNGSDLIYVCGFSVVAGAATGVQFIYGTGTACATGETDLTGVWSFAANGGITNGNAGVPNFVVPAGNAFCLENSGANSIQGHISYVRTATP